MARGKKAAKEPASEERLEQMLVPVDKQAYPIPENWCWVKAKFVSEIYSGNSINEKIKEEKYVGQTNGLIFIATKDIGFNNEINYETNVRIPDFINFKIAPANTALLCVEGGSAGRKVGFVTQDVCFGNKLCAFVTGTANSKYIYYILQSEYFINQFNRKKHGLIGGVSVKDLAEIGFMLAPPAEQQRIVERIESLFSKLDEAKGKAQAVINSFELRKSAILHKAFNGELTEKWRQVNGIGKESWKEVSLIDILIEKPRNGYSPKPVSYETPYKSMTLSATTSGVFMPEYFKYIDEDISKDSYLWLKPGDILIQRANSLEKVGTSAIYTGKEHEFIYPDLMMKLRIKEDNIPEFIAYQLKTEKVLTYLRSNATGTAGNMPKINQKIVSGIPIVVPHVSEQKEIVHILDSLLLKEQQAGKAAESVLNQIETMKKAILARAFHGKLGTNNPAEESVVEVLEKLQEKFHLSGEKLSRKNT